MGQCRRMVGRGNLHCSDNSNISRSLNAARTLSGPSTRTIGDLDNRWHAKMAKPYPIDDRLKSSINTNCLEARCMFVTS
jgi:hypothetical protein